VRNHVAAEAAGAGCGKAVRKGESINDLFRRFAAATSCVLGSPWAFLLAIVFVLVWAAAGPYFDYSNSWQLVINTSTTIGTFLMVFLLQSTQNRDTKAINIKLDELLRAIEGARTGFVNLSDLSDEELDKLEAELLNLGRRAGVDVLSATATTPSGDERGHSVDAV
jgi:low affinity Fe/Cu permease